jgi:hypothetical protein
MERRRTPLQMSAMIGSTPLNIVIHPIVGFFDLANQSITTALLSCSP